MRTRTLLLSLALVGMPALAQNTADQAGTASQQEMQGNSMQGSDSMKSMDAGEKKAHGMRNRDGSGSQHQAMMKSAQSDIDGMRRHLEKMKEQTRNITEQSHRDSMEINNDMWQGLIEHMDKRMAHMQNMMAAGGGKLCATGDEVAVKHYSQ